MVFLVASVPMFSQTNAEKIYRTEREFEKMVGQKGIKAGFIEFLAPDGILFAPDKVNGRDSWKARLESPAALTWNPVLIDVAANGALAYSIGNSIFRPNGNDDPNGIAGHYLSIWVRQPNGEYRAALDTGISHENQATPPSDWKTPPAAAANDRRLSASDSSTAFYQAVETGGHTKAYKSYLAEDAVIMRQGVTPFVGKTAAMKYLNPQKVRVKFAKIKSFLEAENLAYVHSGYTIVDRDGSVKERGNFVQVWKLIDHNWKIVADILIPIPAAK